MAPLPENARIEILLDEAKVARGIVDRRSVRVRIKWREVEAEPQIIAALDGLPPRIDTSTLTSYLEGPDGTIVFFREGELEKWRRGLRFKTSSTDFFDAVRKDPRGKNDPLVAEATEYAAELIRLYQPEFDGYSAEKRAAFLKRTIHRVDQLRISFEGLAKHLEYSTPGKTRPVAPRENPERDVHAAILRVVHKMSTRRIGEELGVRPPRNSPIKRENQTVRKMAERGRELLWVHFGPEEWSARVKRMLALRVRFEQLHAERLENWEALGPKQQFYALLAEYRITSREEEERAALADGFDKKLDDWLGAWEQGDGGRMGSIQLSDQRFDALSLLR
jgi:hypothetical protein